jgi:hypothetical protein
MVVALLIALPFLLTNCGSSKSTNTATTATSLAAAPEEVLTNDCALVHIYRPKSLMGLAIKYHIHFEDEPLFWVTNNSKTTVRVTEPGQRTLRARTEATVEKPIDIELGKEYYVRCSVVMGAAVGRPKIEIVDAATGKQEFDKIPTPKNK